MPVAKALVIRVGSSPCPVLYAALEEAGFEPATVDSFSEGLELAARGPDLIAVEEMTLDTDPEASFLALRQAAPHAEMLRIVGPGAARSGPGPIDPWFLEMPVNTVLLRKVLQYIGERIELMQELRGVIQDMGAGGGASEGPYHLVHDQWFALLERLVQSEVNKT